jgi:hypothetical protein
MDRDQCGLCVCVCVCVSVSGWMGETKKQKPSNYWSPPYIIFSREKKYGCLCICIYIYCVCFERDCVIEKKILFFFFNYKSEEHDKVESQ